MFSSNPDSLDFTVYKKNNILCGVSCENGITKHLRNYTRPYSRMNEAKNRTF